MLIAPDVRTYSIFQLDQKYAFNQKQKLENLLRIQSLWWNVWQQTFTLQLLHQDLPVTCNYDQPVTQPDEDVT